MDTPSTSKYALLDRLAEEFAERYRRGERPSLKEYIDQYPHLEEDLREILPTMVEMEKVDEDQRNEATPTIRPTDLSFRLVGDYRIIREIGRGGMGVVYEAEQQSLGRRVALKILSSQVIGNAKAQERFRREARAAARLHHTNIVPVFEVGQDGDICYYAMQFMQGQSLDQVVEELRRLRQASAGPSLPGSDPSRNVSGDSHVSQIVQSLLIGRLGPRSTDPTVDDVATAGRSSARPGPSASSAVLPGQVELSHVEADHRHYFRSVARVGEQTAVALAHAHARGIVHRDIKPSNLLLDESGVVWVTDFGLAKTEDDGLTNTGELPGTLRYMSPERFQGECDARADVYSLGLTLYEMLVLRPAFDASDRLRLIEQIRLQEPIRPRLLDPQVPRDLETIVLKAIDRDLPRRYQSADELAADLRRFLADEPIRARRTALPERVARWCQRNPAIAALVTAVALSMSLGTATATFFAFRARANEDRALNEKAQANQARDEVNAARQDLQNNLYYAEMNLASQAMESPGGMTRLNELLGHWLPRGGEPDRRGWEWYFLRGLGARDLRTLHNHSGTVMSVNWSPNGRWLASAGDRTVKLWDVASGKDVATLRGHSAALYSVCWSPDGRRLASADEAGLVKLWDLNTRSPIGVLHQQEWTTAVSWSPDGRRLACVGSDRCVHLWDASTGKQVATLRGHGSGAILSVSWSPDGRRLASAGVDRTIKLWDSTAFAEITTLRGHVDEVREVSWSPDGRWLASASADQTIRLWDAKTGESGRILRGHGAWVFTVNWSPDSSRLASAGADHSIKVWDPAAGMEMATFRGHTNWVFTVRFSPDGKRLASAGLDQTIKLWDADTQRHSSTLSVLDGEVKAVSWSRDGRRLAAGSRDGWVQIWGPDLREKVVSLPAHRGSAECVSWSPDGKWLATAGSDGTVKLWDVRTAREIVTLRGHGKPVRGVSWSPDGRRLASAGEDGTIKLWDAETGKGITTLWDQGFEVWAVSWSPDGRFVAGASIDRAARIWDADTGAKRAVLSGHPVYVSAVSWSPDGKRLASASWDQTIKLWNTQDWKELYTLRGHTNDVRAVTWSPGGERLASASKDGTIKLWNPDNGREILSLRGHVGAVYTLDWGADGRLASGGADQTIQLWDATPGFRAERSPRCLEALDRRLQSHPRCPVDLRTRAEIHARRGHWEVAAADWTQAARLEGNRTACWFEAGWWLAGPFRSRVATTAFLGIEPDPLQPLVARGDEGPAHWQPIQPSANGCLDLTRAFPSTRTGSACALVRLYSPLEQPITALVGSSGALRFWQNGRLVHQRDLERPLADDEAIPLSLRVGWNTLLFQVELGSGPNRFSLWLSAEPEHRARALADRGQWEEAIGLLTETLKQQPSLARILLSAARFYRRYAVILRQQRRHDQANRAERDALACYDRLCVLHPDDAGYAGEQAKFLFDGVAKWQVLDPIVLKAARGTTLEKQSDGSILASGTNPLPERYTISARTPGPGITAVRLEALTHPSLPGEGPGRAPNGNFVVNAFRLTAAPASDPARVNRVVLRDAWADHSQDGFPVERAIDGGNRAATGWAVVPCTGQTHVAVFETKEPRAIARDSILTFTLEQHHVSGDTVHNLGCFRLAVTNHPYPTRIARWQESIRSKPNAWTALATARYLRGEWQASLAAIEKSMAGTSGGNGWDRLLLTLVHARLDRPREAARYSAETFAWMGKEDTDTSTWQLVAELLPEWLARQPQPDDPRVRIGRARAYLALNRSEEALAEATRAVQLLPRDLGARQTRADVHLKRGKGEEALADLVKVVDLAPGNRATRNRRANLAACCGMWALAADDFGILARTAPADEDRSWLPWYRHALTLLAAKRTEEYQRTCASMLDRFRDTGDLQTAFFTVWSCALGPDAVPDYEVALELARTALASNNQVSRCHQGVGAILYRLGRLEESLKHFDAALSGDGTQPLASPAYVKFFLAMAHHRLGHEKEGRVWLERAVSQSERELRASKGRIDLEGWVRIPTLRLLRAEAEKVLGQPPGKARN